MTNYNPVVRRLWTSTIGGFGSTLAGAGTYHSDPNNLIDLRQVCDLGLYVAVGASSGTSPTLDVSVDVQDPAGNWYSQVAKITQITAGPATATAFVGLHISGNGSFVLPEYGRVTFTLGGTNPSYASASITLLGR